MTNQTKVKLPREVAEAIEELRKNYGENAPYDLPQIYSLSSERKVCRIIDDYHRMNPKEYFSALVNGYEVEKSPEELEAERKENVREYYEKFSEPSVGRFVESEQYVIAKTLNLLGITIEGINDKEESE